jgi:sugar phosphate isomerase/epimerase
MLMEKMPQLMLEYACARGQPPEALVECAAAGGFDAISLHANGFAKDDPFWIYRDAAQVAKLRAHLRDANIKVAAIDVFPMRDKAQPEDFRSAFEFGAACGARHALATCASTDEDRLIDLICATADLAAEYDIALNVEFSRLGSLPSLNDAVRLVDRVGKSQVGIALDILHWARSEGTIADIVAAGQRVRHVQICDAPETLQAASLLEEAIDGRLCPGDGKLPIALVLDAVPANALFGVEVLNAPATRDDAIAWAASLGEKTRNAFPMASNS